MTKKIWKMCVVGLMLASPAIVTATPEEDVANALAGVGGRYVEMQPGSSITLNFVDECTGTDSAVIVKLAQASSGIRVEFYHDGTSLSYLNEDNWVLNVETGDTLYGPGQLYPFDELRVYWEYQAPPLPQSFDSVKITAYGTTAVYLDAVQAQQALQSVTIDTGEVTVKPDPVVLINNLIASVEAVDTEHNINKSLDAKLYSALAALQDADAQNDGAAANKLQAFINEVNAQADKHIIHAEDAEKLAGEAQAIIDVLT